MDDLTQLDAFVDQLRLVAAHLGSLQTDGDPGSHPVLVTPDDRRFAFVQTLVEIHAAISLLDGGILAEPKDASLLQGQLRLFSVHLEEAVDTASLGARTLRIVSFGVVAG